TTRSTLATPVGGNTGAEVVIELGGRFVWGSNRGADTIATFAIDSSGSISLSGSAPTTGRTPRSFTLAGDIMLVANQRSNMLVPFRVDATGTIAPTGTAVTASGPEFVGTVALPR